MLRYTLRRVLMAIITIWAIVTITFILMHAIPGDPFLSERTPAALRQVLLQRYGLDKPWWEQYWLYLGNLLSGDLGISMRYQHQTVTAIIGAGFPVSATLGLTALVVAFPLGLVLGLLAALKYNTPVDFLVLLLILLAVSLPSFVVAGGLQYLIGLKLGWLPLARWQGFPSSILPAIALGLAPAAVIARFVRTGLLEQLGQDYIRTAYARGLTPVQVVLGHALRNALLPLLGILGPLIAGILTGSIVVEQVFAIPGLGSHYVQSIINRDYTLILGTTIFYAGILLTSNLLVDLLYGLLDPRIRLANRH